MTSIELLDLVGTVLGWLIAIAALAKGNLDNKKTRSEIGKTFQERDKVRAEADKLAAETIRSLHEQIGIATTAEGALREELQRIHIREEQLKQDVTNLNTQVASQANTNETLSALNEHILLEKRQIANENAVLKKQLIDKETEKQALNELVQKLHKEVGELHGKVSAVEQQTGEFQKTVTQELRKKS